MFTNRWKFRRRQATRRNRRLVANRQRTHMTEQLEARTAPGSMLFDVLAVVGHPIATAQQAKMLSTIQSSSVAANALGAVQMKSEGPSPSAKARTYHVQPERQDAPMEVQRIKETAPRSGRSAQPRTVRSDEEANRVDTQTAQSGAQKSERDRDELELEAAAHEYLVSSGLDDGLEELFGDDSSSRHTGGGLGSVSQLGSFSSGSGGGSSQPPMSQLSSGAGLEKVFPGRLGGKRDHSHSSTALASSFGAANPIFSSALSAGSQSSFTVDATTAVADQPAVSAVSSINADDTHDLTGGSTARDADANAVSSARRFRTLSLGFQDGLADWNITEIGGSPQGYGTVTEGSAVLHEGDSFLVTLDRQLTMTEEVGTLEFAYKAFFDTSDPDSIKDAFEVALVDAAGFSLVDTFSPERDAFYNVTEGLTAAMGDGVTESEASRGTKVSLNMSQVPVGSEATLIFRLVNNDSDEETTVRILNVELASGTDSPPSVTVALANDTAPPGPGTDAYLTDRLTNDPTVAGTVSDDDGVEQLEIQVDDGPFVDITASLQDGQYTYDPGNLEPGAHRITVRATDALQQTAVASIEFTVNASPSVDAGGDRNVGEGSTVLFDASGSTDSLGEIYSYSWSFHDGTAVDSATAENWYPQDSHARVQFVGMGTGSADQSFVLPASLSPQESLTIEVEDTDAWDPWQEVGSLQESAAGDPHYELEREAGTIRFGDGVHGRRPDAGQRIRATYPGAVDAVFPVTLTIVDTAGTTVSQTIFVTVDNLASLITDPDDVTGAENGPVTLLVEFSDPGILDNHTAMIDWGDGSSSAGVVEERDGTGTVSDTHVYADNGTFAVQVSISDHGGSTAITDATAEIDNIAPSIVISGPQELGTGQQGQYVLSADDPSSSDLEAPFTYEIDWDGDSITDQEVVGPASGVEVTHVFDSPGSYVILATATDKDGDTGPEVQYPVTVAEQKTAYICGYVYLDVNNNGIKDNGEMGLPNVPITLSGHSTATVRTNTNGWYEFADLMPGTYSIYEMQPAAFLDGKDTPGKPAMGQVGNDSFHDLPLASGTEARDYNFGERGLVAELISKRFFLASTPNGHDVLSAIAAGNGADWFTFQANSHGEFSVSVDESVNESRLELYTAEFMPVALSHGGHRLAASVVEGKQYLLHVSGDAREETISANLAIETASSNIAFDDDSLDVNGDGWVSPLDALMIIASLNRSGIEGTTSGAIDDALDVNGDGHLSPIDALIVITYLNSRDVGEGEGEDQSRDESQAVETPSLTPPTITVTSPEDGVAVTPGQSMLIAGIAQADVPDAQLVNVTVNGQPVNALDEAGHFFFQTAILPGENAFEITATDSLGQEAADSLVVVGSEPADGVAESLLFDVSPSFNDAYARTSFNEQNNRLHAQIAIENVGQYSVDIPFYVGVRNISEPTVNVVGEAGRTEDGVPYYNFSEAVPGSSFDASEITGFVNATFRNPNRVPFTYELVYLAKLNEPPTFTSIPGLETHPGHSYNYDADAIDPDEDTLKFALKIAPEDMTIDEATGAVSWTPSAVDEGLHQLVVIVDDGRGGSAEQRYALSVVEPPPNRPPIITSVPVTEANVPGSAIGGKIVVANDSSTLSQQGFTTVPSDTQHFVRNVANYFTGGTPGSFLGYSNDEGLTGGALADAFAHYGHQWTVSTEIDFTVDELKEFDGVFVGGYPADNSILIEYVQQGGCVYLFAGSADAGAFEGHAGVEADVWDHFLRDFGLSLSPTPNTITGTVAIGQVTHPLFVGVNQLYQDVGQSPLDLDEHDGRGHVLTSLDSNGLLAAYDFVSTPSHATYKYDVDAWDPDGDAISYKLLEEPDRMWIQPDSGIIYWSPDASQLGQHAVSVEALDGRGGSAIQRYTIQVGQAVENHAPAIVSEPVTGVALGEVFRYDVEAVDPDGDPISYSLTDGPAGMTVDSQSGVILWEQQPGFQTALELDGRSNHVIVPDAPSLDFLGNYTISFWARPRILKQGYSPIIAKRDESHDASTGPFQVYMHHRPSLDIDHALVWDVGNANTSYVRHQVDGFFTGSENTWVHVALVMDGTAMHIYKNGELESTQEYSGVRVTNDAPIFLGKLGHLDEYWHGLLDEVRLWSVARPPTKIAAEDASEVNSESVGLVAYWRFDEARGYDVFDCTNNENHGALAGAYSDGEIGPWARAANPYAPDVFDALDESVEFFDGTFDDSVWDYVDYGHGKVDKDDPSKVGGEGITERREDGSGNEYMYIWLKQFGAPSSSDSAWIQRFHRNSAARYTPSEQGAIYAIDYAYAAHAHGSSQGARIALEQDGEVYVASHKVPSPVQWSTYRYRDLRAEDFWSVDTSRVYPPGAGHPDFTDAGSEMIFGFIFHVGIGIGEQYPSAYSISVDNWSVTIRPTLRTAATVAAHDGRGGADEQAFALDITTPAEIHGFGFNDLEHDGAYDRGHILLAAELDGIRRYDMASTALIDRQNVPGLDDLTFGPDGNLYGTSVSHPEATDRVLRFDGVTGRLLDEFVPQETSGIIVAGGLAFGPDGNLYVSSAGTEEIRRYDGHTGEFLDVFVAGLDGPADVVFGDNGDLYLADGYDAKVMRYDRDTGERKRTLGYGSGPGLAFGPDGDLYVGDWRQGHVYRFSGQSGQSKGVFIARGEGGMHVPQDLAFAPDGLLYIPERLHGLMLRFDSWTGDFVDVFATLEEPQDEYRAAIALESDETSPDVGIPNWTVYLDENRNGQRDDWERSTTTDESGRYAFGNLGAGTYVVAQEIQEGWRRSGPTDGIHLVTVSSGETAYNQDFGNYVLEGVRDNVAPTFTTEPATEAYTESRFTYRAKALDADGDPLGYDLVVYPDGMTVEPLTGVVVWIPEAGDVGTHTVLLRVQDGQGGVALQSFELLVSMKNHGPHIMSEPPASAVAGLPWEYQVVAEDPDGDQLAYSITGPSGIDIEPDSGMVAWVPSLEQADETHVVEVTATDGHESVTQAFNVTVRLDAVNRSPVIHSSPRTNTAIGRTYVYRVEASDLDGDPLDYRLEDAPAGMTIDQQGFVTWQPDASQLGPHAVSLIVSDGRDGSAIQDFTIDVQTKFRNAAPRIVSKPVMTAIVGRKYRYDAKAMDPDQDALMWRLDAHPEAMALNPVTGTVVWVPESTQLGPQQVVLTVVDTAGREAQQEFSVHVRSVNVPPTINSAPPTIAYVDSIYRYAVRAQDLERDALVFSLDVAPEGMSINLDTGFVQWKPEFHQVTAHDVTIVVTDDQGGWTAQKYVIEVFDMTDNRAPVIVSTPQFVATVDEPYDYTVIADDPDGDRVEFTLLEAPVGMGIDDILGAVSWTPTNEHVGEHRVKIAAVDSGGKGATQSYILTVNDTNSAPAITSDPLEFVYARDRYRYDVWADDPDGDEVGYQLALAPDNMHVDSWGRIAWSPEVTDAGTHPIEIVVTDSRGLAATQAFDLEVALDDEKPSVSLFVSANPVSVGVATTFRVSATDNVGVESVELRINDQSIPLDVNGRATLTAEPAGFHSVEAYATDTSGNVKMEPTTWKVNDPSDQNAPEVFIHSPADEAVITSPVTVKGTVDDPEDNLVLYTVSVAPVGSTEFVELFRGESEVANDTLGIFDPSGLVNGTYLLRLSATDAGGFTSFASNVIEVAGNLKIGNFTLSFTDLSIPVSGIPITVTRTYDSLNAASQDALGYGWRLEFRDTNLKTSVERTSEFEQELGIYNPFYDGARVYVTLPGGKREGFTFKAQRKSGFAGYLAFYDPVFVPDGDVTSSLSVPQYTLMQNEYGECYSPNGLKYNPEDALNFGGVYYLTTQEGLAYKIDAKTGDLSVIADTNGNSLTFTDTSIDSSTGQHVTFDRDPRGRIIAATDPMGNRVQYQYDAKGDLVKVTDRDGNETYFVYDEPTRPHFLTEVIDPLGRTGVKTEYDEQGRLVKLIDAGGNAVQLIHDPENSIESITDALGNTTTFVYDTYGNVITEVDTLGNVTQRTYDSRNRILTETDPLGNTTSFTYNPHGDLLSETDPLGNSTIFTYQSFSNFGLLATTQGARPYTRLASTTDPLGNTTTNSYDSSGNLLTTTDAEGNTTTFTYDGGGNQTSITDAQGNVTEFEYESHTLPDERIVYTSNLIRQVDPLGNVTSFTYDANGNQLTETTTVTTPSGPRTLVTTTTYDASGRPTSVTDAEGNTTYTQYDALGNQVATIDALERRTEFQYDDRAQLVGMEFADGTSTEMAYDALGRRISSTDRTERVTRYEYDALGRITTTIYPDDTPEDDTDNPRTETEYDAAGRVAAQIDERENRTEFEYDDAGRQTLVRDALGHETVTAYDTAGRRTGVTDALGRITQFVYDTLGRQVETVFADGSSSNTSYDALGRMVAQTDQAGNVTQFEYDKLGRLTAVVDALDHRTQYGYDEAGNLVSQKDANDHVTEYEYDGVGRRVATILPLDQRSATTYDAAGNVASTTDFNGQETTYAYDENYRLVSKTFADGSSVVFTYTATGQRASVLDERGTTTYEHNVRDRLTKRTDPYGATISYTYDVAGNRTSVNTTVPGTDARTTSYAFDALNRQASVTDPEGLLTSYTYDAVGNLVSTQYPNQTKEEREYDDLNRLVMLEHTGPEGVIASYEYSLDDVGHRVSVEEHNGRSVGYEYDALYRLIGETITDSANGDRSITYEYDEVGNRLSRVDSLEGTTTYEYDENDRLIVEVLGDDETRYTYDDKGNTLSKATLTDEVFYDWDEQGHLIAVDTDGDGTDDITYEYDADGIRVATTSDGQETRYLVDSNRPYAQVLEEYTPGGVIRVSYVHGLDLISQDRTEDGGNVYHKSFYHVDGLGSTRALTNGSGLVTDRYIYDAFGRTIGQAGSTGNVFLFAGEQRDLVTGLDYLRARWMSPSVGRFYGMDSFEGLLRDPVTLHRFLYGGGNPVNNIDPSGQVTLASVMGATIIQRVLRQMEWVSRAYAFKNLVEKASNAETIAFFATVGIMAPIVLQTSLDTGFPYEFKTPGPEKSNKQVILEGRGDDALYVKLKLGDEWISANVNLQDVFASTLEGNLHITAPKVSREMNFTTRTKIRGVSLKVGFGFRASGNWSANLSQVASDLNATAYLIAKIGPFGVELPVASAKFSASIPTYTRVP